MLKAHTVGSLVRNAIRIQRHPHPSDSMPATELAHSRREGKPMPGRVAGDGKNGNIGRKIDHTEPDSEAAPKDPAGTARVRSNGGPARPSCGSGSAPPKGAAAAPRAHGGGVAFSRPARANLSTDHLTRTLPLYVL